MQISGTQHLNEYVARYVLAYLQKIKFQQTRTEKNDSAWRFLRLSAIPSQTDPSSLGDLAEDAAYYVRKRVLGNEPKQSMRSIVRDHPHLEPLLGHGAQSWLILTYFQTLQQIYEIDNGTVQYGLGKGSYRNIKENVIASRMMFADGSQRLAEKMYELYGEIGNQLALIEGGAGNGAATLTMLKQFQRHGKFPLFWLTDIDEKTLIVAENYYREKGNFQSHHFPWSLLDIGDAEAVHSLLNSFPGFKTVFNVNFIVHEWEPIAARLFKSMSNNPNTDLVVSEFFLPPGYPNCDPDPNFPWWFVYLHELSNQYLRTENDFLTIIQKYGYKVFDRIDYQTHKGQPVTSTLFLRKI
jgi:hypothetical protein